MRAITVRQPWASLIACGAKTIETRGRRCNHRGLVLIHAGARLYTAADKHADRRLWFAAHDHLDFERNNGVYLLPYGAVVATAQLVDCVPIETPESEIARGPLMLWTSGAGDLKLARHVERGPLDADEHPWVTEADLDEQLPYGDFAPGRWGLLLDDIRPLAQPVPARGQQAVPWRVPEDVAAAVLEQVQS